ncbi:hypothetical protein D3C75_377990 [compost metagenome]
MVESTRAHFQPFFDDRTFDYDCLERIVIQIQIARAADRQRAGFNTRILVGAVASRFERSAYAENRQTFVLGQVPVSVDQILDITLLRIRYDLDSRIILNEREIAVHRRQRVAKRRSGILASSIMIAANRIQNSRVFRNIFGRAGRCFGSGLVHCPFATSVLSDH